MLMPPAAHGAPNTQAAPSAPAAQLTIASWNINSVRLRLPLVLRFLAQHQPDILCLQETKCPNELFPAAAFAEAGWRYQAINGQKGYHGVATLSRLPLRAQEIRQFCGKNDCRHIAAEFSCGARAFRLHNVYLPAGGDEPNAQENPKFAHKLQFLDELQGLEADRGDSIASLLVGDLNIAPLEHDVWSHRQMLKVVSHTPIETDGLKRAQAAGGWADILRAQIPPAEKLYTWWSYRARDWAASNRGRRLDHIWASPALLPALLPAPRGVEILREARGWEKPSDHVPIIARFAF